MSSSLVNGAEVKLKMGIDKELKRQVYKFDYERAGQEGNTAIWINKKAGLGVRLEWFSFGCALCQDIRTKQCPRVRFVFLFAIFSIFLL